jgi:hypothetical protein
MTTTWFHLAAGLSHVVAQGTNRANTFMSAGHDIRLSKLLP